MSTPLDADVVVVGYGPVGQTMAAMLARGGHRVPVYERYSSLYGRPRAIYFDDEIMRVWQQVGIVDEIAGDLMPNKTYDWFGADGEPILNIEFPPGRPAGRRGTCSFSPTSRRRWTTLSRRCRPLSCTGVGAPRRSLTRATMWRSRCAVSLSRGQGTLSRRTRRPPCGRGT